MKAYFFVVAFFIIFMIGLFFQKKELFQDNDENKLYRWFSKYNLTLVKKEPYNEDLVFLDFKFGKKSRASFSFFPKKKYCLLDSFYVDHNEKKDTIKWWNSNRSLLSFSRIEWI